MKTRVLLAMILVMSVLLLASVSWSEDAAALFKSKCALCHGANGEGKPPKVPALKGVKMDEGKIADYITKGDKDRKPPHNAGVKGITDDQAKALAAYVKSLK